MTYAKAVMQMLRRVDVTAIDKPAARLICAYLADFLCQRCYTVVCSAVQNCIVVWL